MSAFRETACDLHLPVTVMGPAPGTGCREHPPRSCHSSQQSPQPFTHLCAGTGRCWMRSQVLLLQPSRGAGYCTMQQTPSFPCGPPCGKRFLLSPFLVRPYPYLCLPSMGQIAQLFPDTLQTSGNAPSPSLRAAREALGSALAKLQRAWIPFPSVSARGGEILPRIYSF